MNETSRSSPAHRRTTVERKSDRELVVTRRFDAPVSVVFEAWTRSELFMRWWAPKSSGVPLISCDMDVRTGGSYRLEFGKDRANTMAFFGKYLEVVPNSRLVWTNDEGSAGAITTVTFEDDDGATLLTYREAYPSKEALDQAIGGMDGAIAEQFQQLDALLEASGASQSHA